MNDSPGLDHSPKRQAPDGGSPRGWMVHAVLACVGGIAIAGMVFGLYDPVSPYQQPHVDAAHEAQGGVVGNVPEAVSYAQIPSTLFGTNADWKTVWPKTAKDPTAFYGSQPADAESRGLAIAQRVQRRAYSGAPPVVPHAIDQQSAASCLVCHGQGLAVGMVIAPRMSHQSYNNCTQCHVESVNRSLPPTAGLRVAGNRFQGLSSPGPGERAWPGAPPTIPHTTWMRENCNSCHGELASAGLRTSHPWRGSCLQCHGPSAAFDQRWGVFAERPPVGSREARP